MVEKVVVMNCHVQQKVKVGKTVCDVNITYFYAFCTLRTKYYKVTDN